MLAGLYIILLSSATILNLYMPKAEVNAEQGSMVIPHEAIRLRILADSDAVADQEVKRLVRDAVNAEITKWVEELISLEEARNVIISKIPEIQEIATEVVAAQGLTQSVKTEFGPVKFPTKLYGQFLYPAGEYEAILITLGEGTGANWWCVLFPPLCFLDFSNGEATSAGFEDGNSTEVPDEEKDKDMNKGKDSNADKNKTAGDNTTTATANADEKAPLYEAEDEAPVEVRFFLVDLWNKLFS